HVGAHDQLLDDRDGLGLSQVEGEAALVAVDGQERRGHLALGPRAVGELAARVVALARLDLDHVGAEQPELVRPVGAGEIPGEIEDADPRERFAHARTSSRLALATLLTTSNSLRRSSSFSGVSLVRSR